MEAQSFAILQVSFLFCKKCVPLKLLLHKRSLKYHIEAWWDASFLSRLLFLIWKSHIENGDVMEVFPLGRAWEFLDTFVSRGRLPITVLGKQAASEQHPLSSMPSQIIITFPVWTSMRKVSCLSVHWKWTCAPHAHARQSFGMWKFAPEALIT